MATERGSVVQRRNVKTSKDPEQAAEDPSRSDVRPLGVGKVRQWELAANYCASRRGKGHTASALSRNRTRGSEDLGWFLWTRQRPTSKTLANLASRVLERCLADAWPTTSSLWTMV